MRVVHLCNQVLEGGGTAKAVLDLHKSLLRSGIESFILVSPFRRSDKRTNIIRSKVLKRSRPVRLVFYWVIYYGEKLIARCVSLACSNWVSFPFIFVAAGDKIERLRPDIVHIHSIQDTLISCSELASLKAAKVWSLHDLSGIQGVMHLPCKGRIAEYIDNMFFRYKRRCFGGASINYICPTEMVKMRAVRMLLLESDNSSRVIRIPNMVTIDSQQSRSDSEALMPTESKGKAILFGAANFRADKNKGWSRIEELIKSIDRGHLDCYLGLFGDDTYSTQESLRGRVKSFGMLQEPWYSVINVWEYSFFFAASEFETFGILAIEAALLGIPVVCFEGTGTAEFVTAFNLGVVLSPEISPSALIDRLQESLSIPRLEADSIERLSAYVGQMNVCASTIDFYRRCIQNADKPTREKN